MASKADPIITYIIAMGLGEREDQFRGLLHSAGLRPGDLPLPRHFAIATATLMLMDDGLPMSTIFHIVSLLRDQTDAALSENVTATLNKTHLVISASNGGDVKVHKIIDLAETTAPKFVFKSEMYFVSALYKHAQEVLAGKA